MLKAVNSVQQAQSVAQVTPRDQIFIDNLVLEAFIGVFDHEYDTPQSIRFDVSLDILPLEEQSVIIHDGQTIQTHDMRSIVRYDHIVADIKAILKAGHIELVETLAEHVAAACLSYARCEKAQVRIAKLDAFDQAGAVGVQITRNKA